MSNAELNENLLEALQLAETNERKAKVQEHLRAIHTQAYRVQVEVLEDGKIPTKAHTTDAGFDVFATEDLVVKPGQVFKHPLNIRLALPAGCWAEIQSKSGLGTKGLLIYAGVIDESYRGIVHAIGTNLNHHDNQDIVIKKGQKIAQLTMNVHSNAYYMEQVGAVDTNTTRGSGGFGSSGA